MSNVLRSTKIDVLSTSETEIFPPEPAKNIGGSNRDAGKFTAATESDEKFDLIEHFHRANHSILGLPLSKRHSRRKPLPLSLTGKTQSGNMALCWVGQSPRVKLWVGGAGERDSVFTVADFYQKQIHYGAIGD